MNFKTAILIITVVSLITISFATVNATEAKTVKFKNKNAPVKLALYGGDELQAYYWSKASGKKIHIQVVNKYNKPVYEEIETVKIKFQKKVGKKISTKYKTYHSSEIYDNPPSGYIPVSAVVSFKSMVA